MTFSRITMEVAITSSWPIARLWRITATTQVRVLGIQVTYKNGF